MIISSFQGVFELLKLSEVCIILQDATKAEWLEPSANGRNIVGKKNSQHCWESLRSFALS